VSVTAHMTRKSALAREDAALLATTHACRDRSPRARDPGWWGLAFCA
jgi:hypothetical protein